MKEVEVKLRVEGPERVLMRLKELGFTFQSRSREHNFVYDTPDGSIHAAGKLLRVRELDDEAVLTVKLPAEAGTRHKVREEHEITTPDAKALHAILGGLGYQVAWRYEKVRTEYRREGDPGVVEFDHTPIGDFIELEGEAAWIDHTAADLGYSADDYITLNYRALFEQALAEGRIATDDMVFEA
jgi:adenylate cyclase class 2